MHLRLLALAATLFVAGCASQSQTGPSRVMRTAAERDKSAGRVAWINGSELRVRLNQDLGAVASPAKDTFTARTVAPIVGSNGRVVVPVGSLVWGHVVHVDDASRRVEIVFDRLETRTAVYHLSATVIAAQPFAVTVRPEGTDSSASVVLQGSAPSAIGGGPVAPASENEDGAPRGDVIVPFDAELQLKITAPLVATSS